MIIFRRNPADPPPEPPATKTGRQYRYELSYDGDHRRAYADTLTELCGALIEDYDPEATTQRLVDEGVPADQLDAQVTGELDELRILHTVDIQVRLQADINAQEPIDQLPGDQQHVLRGDRVTQPVIARWDAAVPLVLSTHDYLPEGELALPTGNIIWLDPRDEATFLESLASAGIVRLAASIAPKEASTNPPT